MCFNICVLKYLLVTYLATWNLDEHENTLGLEICKMTEVSTALGIKPGGPGNPRGLESWRLVCLEAKKAQERKAGPPSLGLEA